MPMVHDFTRVLADLWNEIKKNSFPLRLTISDDDIVVFVVGPTGSGKSWFIREATENESVTSSRGYHSSTTKVQAIRCGPSDEVKSDLQIEGVKSIVFVDTPSFLAGHDDIDARKEIRAWINRTGYKPQHLIGIIYMHRIENDPVVPPTMQGHLRELVAVPGIYDSHHPLRLHIVISYDVTSGRISDSKIAKHKSSLHTQMDLLNKSKWKPSMHQVQFQGEPKVAWRAVENLFRTDHGGPVSTTSNSTSYHRIQRIVTPRRVTAFELGNNDIVVFVVGPSGAGKSLFVGEVTKSNLVKVGTNLQPCTAKVQAIRCELTDEAKTALRAAIQKNIVFVDTPSFHTVQNRDDAEKDMKNWLNKSKFKSTRVGIIYMHRVETDPYNESIQQHLDTFAYAFPPNFVPLPNRVHAVLSYEGVIPQDTIRSRKEIFQAQLCELRPSLGGKLRWATSSHPDLFKAGESETAWKAVVELFSPTQA